MEYPIYLKNIIGAFKIESATKATQVQIDSFGFQIFTYITENSIDKLIKDNEPATEKDWILAVMKFHDKSLYFCNENLKVSTSKEELINADL